MSQLAFVKLSEIHLWEENPRTGSVDNEDEGILALIQNQQIKERNKLISLAKSLANDGLYEPVGILKHNNGSMVVKEGNRRILCLKLLKKPEIITSQFPKIYEAFKELKKNVNKSIFDSIPARIFNEDENESLEKWVELRHNGVQGGKGLDKWGAKEKMNWNNYRGRNTPLLKFHEYLISQNILSKEEVNSVSKTNWDRILGTVGRKYLGLDFKDKKDYVIKITPSEFKQRITRTVKELSGKRVGIVYSNEQIDEFFKKLNFNKEEIQEDKKDTPKSNGTGDSMNNDRRPTKPAPFLSNLICDLASSQETDGIIRLSDELSRMSKYGIYRNYPIAAAVLMRSLLEQCLIYYLKKRNKWRKFYEQKGKDPTLSKIIEKYCSDSDIFAQDNKIARHMSILTEGTGLKNYFDMIVHHPYQFHANPDLLNSIAQNGYLALVQYIIDYK